MAISAGGRSVVFDVATGSKVQEYRGHRAGGVTFEYSPDGTRLASGGHDHTVRFWRVSDGKLLKTRRPRGWDVMSVRFQPDGQRVSAGLTDSRILLFDWPVPRPD